MKTIEEILKDYNITKETRHHSYDYIFSKLPEIMKKHTQQFIDEIDFDLAHIEDTAKGEYGNQITKLRGKIKNFTK